MKIYTGPNGAQLTPGQPFSLNGEKFADNWLANAAPDALIAKGVTVTDVADPVAAASSIVQGPAFLARVQDAELAIIEAAAVQNAQLQRWMEDLRLKGIVDVVSAEAVAAKAALVAAKLLTQDRADLIFAMPA